MKALNFLFFVALIITAVVLFMTATGYACLIGGLILVSLYFIQNWAAWKSFCRTCDELTQKMEDVLDNLQNDKR